MAPRSFDHPPVRPHNELPRHFWNNSYGDDVCTLQGYLAHKKTLNPLGPPKVPRHRATVGSYGGGGSYARGTPVFTCAFLLTDPHHLNYAFSSALLCTTFCRVPGSASANKGSLKAKPEQLPIELTEPAFALVNRMAPRSFNRMAPRSFDHPPVRQITRRAPSCSSKVNRPSAINFKA